MLYEPIRHHFIPQFILRNFCFDENHRHLYYYDKAHNEQSVQQPQNIFMVRNLYRDEINSAAFPTQIESDLSRYEQEAASLIREKFLTQPEFLLTAEEDEKLKLFFAIMALRAKNTKKQFVNDFCSETRAFYAQWQSDCNLEDLWKRNLGYIVNCRSLTEVLNHPDIAPPFKIFLRRDSFGYVGNYFCIAESQEDYEFFIGDTYPVVVFGTLPNGIPLGLYSIFPISPHRILLLANKGVLYTPRTELNVRPCLFTEPRHLSQNGGVVIRVRHIMDEEAGYFNSLVFENAKDGVAFQNKNFFRLHQSKIHR